MDPIGPGTDNINTYIDNFTGDKISTRELFQRTSVISIGSEFQVISVQVAQARNGVLQAIRP